MIYSIKHNKSSLIYLLTGSKFFLKIKRRLKEKIIYPPQIKAMFSTVKPLSIKIPNTAVPIAVENTIKEVVNAFMLPIYLTPYISAQVDEPKTLPNPLEIPIKPKKR